MVNPIAKALKAPGLVVFVLLCDSAAFGLDVLMILNDLDLICRVIGSFC